MNLGALQKLSYRKRIANDRNRFVGSSLTSSAELSDRILAWSGVHTRERLHVMKFHGEWKHPSCSVMKWYRLQNLSSTRFREIEHRQSIQGPFYHEFLLLRLTDGSICRVERTGSGSRTDALRAIGCAAHDLIQWFTAETYEAFAQEGPSNLVAVIDLGKEFDIIDVLAICYSIQKTLSCRAYTLQRYNCYFFCLTILSVLTRRLASWETVVKQEMWAQSVYAALDTLTNLTPEKAKAHLILRACSLFDPGNPKPADFIIDELRTHLVSQSDSLAHINDALGVTLWRTGWNPALDMGLEKSLENVCKSVLQRENKCTLALRSAFYDSREKMGQVVVSHRALQKLYVRECLFHISSEISHTQELISQEQRMLEIERPPPFGAHAICSLAGLFAGLVCVMHPGKLWGEDDDLLDFGSVNIGNRIAVMKYGRMVTPLVFMTVLRDDESYVNIGKKHRSLISDNLNSFAVNTAMNKLEAKGMLGSIETIALINSATGGRPWKGWLSSTILETLGKKLERILQTDLLSTVCVTYTQSDGAGFNCIDVVQFQEDYIHKRIQAHADRVDAHQLAAAPLVVKDMQEAMSDVWKAMPLGFGAKMKTD